MDSPEAVAKALCRIRINLRTSRALSVNQLEALLWIAAGADRFTELQQAMQMDTKSCHRLLSVLRGVPNRETGRVPKWENVLVETRKHPHKRGLQLLLSRHAQSMLSATFTEGAKIGNNSPEADDYAR